mgnify:CR=1 FL=1
MTSINDFATTYMCQSLPFGGVKHSGKWRQAQALSQLPAVHTVLAYTGPAHPPSVPRCRCSC